MDSSVWWQRWSGLVPRAYRVLHPQYSLATGSEDTGVLVAGHAAAALEEEMVRSGEDLKRHLRGLYQGTGRDDLEGCATSAFRRELSGLFAMCQPWDSRTSTIAAAAIVISVCLSQSAERLYGGPRLLSLRMRCTPPRRVSKL